MNTTTVKSPQRKAKDWAAVARPFGLFSIMITLFVGMSYLGGDDVIAPQVLGIFFVGVACFLVMLFALVKVFAYRSVARDMQAEADEEDAEPVVNEFSPGTTSAMDEAIALVAPAERQTWPVVDVQEKPVDTRDQADGAVVVEVEQQSTTPAQRRPSPRRRTIGAAIAAVDPEMEPATAGAGAKG